MVSMRLKEIPQGFFESRIHLDWPLFMVFCQKKMANESYLGLFLDESIWNHQGVEGIQDESGW